MNRSSESGPSAHASPSVLPVSLSGQDSYPESKPFGSHDIWSTLKVCLYSKYKCASPSVLPVGLPEKRSSSGSKTILQQDLPSSWPRSWRSQKFAEICHISLQKNSPIYVCSPSNGSPQKNILLPPKRSFSFFLLFHYAALFSPPHLTKYCLPIRFSHVVLLYSFLVSSSAGS